MWDLRQIFEPIFEPIFELTYKAPLVALLLTSLGLIALKLVLKRVSGLPLWMQRVMAPPFYFISLPVATLLVGTVLLATSARGICRLILAPEALNFLIAASLWVLPRYDPVAWLRLLNFFIAPFVVLPISGYMLWRTLSDVNGHRLPSRHRLRALLLVLAFAWAVLSISPGILVSSL